MTLKTSTGLRDGMLSTAPARTLLNLGKIKIFAGAEPATADAAETGTLLCTISVNSTGTGLTFESASVGGVLSKSSSEIWSGVNAAGGTATHYRFVGSADTGALSTTEPRIQGGAALLAGDLNLSSLALVSGATQTIDSYVIALPTL